MVLASTVMLKKHSDGECFKKVNKVEECVKNIKHWIFSKFLHDSDMTGSTCKRTTCMYCRYKLSDSIVCVDGHSVWSCAAVKDLGMIIVSSLSFKANIYNSVLFISSQKNVISETLSRYEISWSVS